MTASLIWINSALDYPAKRANFILNALMEYRTRKGKIISPRKTRGEKKKDKLWAMTGSISDA